MERPRQQMEGIGEKQGEVEIVGVNIGTQSLWPQFEKVGGGGAVGIPELLNGRD